MPSDLLVSNFDIQWFILIFYFVWSNSIQKKATNGIYDCHGIQRKWTYDKYQVEVIELRRLLALDVVPPVADAVLLVEDGALWTQERGLPFAGLADVEDLQEHGVI